MLIHIRDAVQSGASGRAIGRRDEFGDPSISLGRISRGRCDISSSTDELSELFHGSSPGFRARRCDAIVDIQLHDPACGHGTIDQAKDGCELVLVFIVSKLAKRGKQRL